SVQASEVDFCIQTGGAADLVATPTSPRRSPHVTLSTDHTSALVDALGTGFNGQVITPNDDTYDQARTVYPGTIDRRPAVIARPSDATQVARVIAAAKETGIPLAVRGGGHSNAGHGVCDGGLVLDLSAMKAIDIDVEGRTAWASAGLTAREYTTDSGGHGPGNRLGHAGPVGV